MFPLEYPLHTLSEILQYDHCIVPDLLFVSGGDKVAALSEQNYDDHYL